MGRTAVLAAAALLLAGCGGGSDSSEAAADYVEAANRIQAELSPVHREAQAAVRAFARGRSGTRIAERLQAASSTMRETRASLSLLRPPPEARSLHSHLLELLDLQAGVTLELSLAADYLPDAVAAIRPAEEAGGALARALRSATTGGQQADALEDYSQEVDAVLERLGALGPPPVLNPWHGTQIARLEASRNLAAQLARGIRGDDRTAIDRALGAFSDQTPDPKVAQKAQAEAVKAFNKRLEEQQELLETIYREQAELAAGSGS